MPTSKASLHVFPKCSVADILEKHPEAVPVFLRHRMICVGCQMAVFDTLEEAAQNYALPVNTFLQELRREIETNSR